MSCFIVQGKAQLSGSITPQGNKNEALPVLAATLLTSQPIALKNIPHILDVLHMIELLKSVGVEVVKHNDHEYLFHAREIHAHTLDFYLMTQLRGSLTLVAPLLKRSQHMFLPRPGGDKIGRRRIDTHILVFKAFGVLIDVSQKGYELKTQGPFIGTDILLDEASVTATENAIMAAVSAQGQTIIRNAASEPHVQQLCHFLNSLGARIQGIGSNVLTIDGVEEIRGGTHTLSPDYLEVGSFIGMAAVTCSEIRIKNAGITHLRMIMNVFQRLGITLESHKDDIIVPRNQKLRIVSDYHDAIPKIDDAPWPGFPADLISIALVIATQCEGAILFFEKMYESRLFFVDKLIAMGAKIILCDPHRALITGPSPLIGATLSSPDIRAGVALLIAAMAAEGESVIHNITQIDRGYERIEQRLQQLGASIQRVHDNLS